MSPTLLITPALGSAIVSAAEEAKIDRDQLLHQASLVTTVADRIDADDATSVLRSLKAFVSTIEAQRKAAKEPALDIGRGGGFGGWHAFIRMRHAAQEAYTNNQKSHQKKLISNSVSTLQHTRPQQHATRARPDPW